MLIVGARGHAIEVFQCLPNDAYSSVVFYDDISLDLLQIFSLYNVCKTPREAEAIFKIDKQYVLGIGGPVLRQQMVTKFNDLGGELKSVIAQSAIISEYSYYGSGLNIMHNTFVAPNAFIGDGVLLNHGVAVHHDSIVGDYCELSPGARVLGRCYLENNILIGSSATILPDIKIGANSIVGAGAVVTKDLPSNSKVVGIPARHVV